MFVDTHCHVDGYDIEKLRLMLGEAASDGVEAIIAMGMDLESSAQTADRHRVFPALWPAVGIHPWRAIPVDSLVYARLAEMAGWHGVVGIGEVGLHYDPMPPAFANIKPPARKVQRECFQAFLRLARETGLALSVHCRGAHQDMMALLRRQGKGVTGTVHGFAGDRAQLQDWLDLGFCVSIGYRATQPGGEALLNLTREIPLDRLLLETDSSIDSAYGSPEPFTPSHVRPLAEKLGKARSLTPEKLGRATTANARRLFRPRD